jgi:hypothetical protein
MGRKLGLGAYFLVGLVLCTTGTTKGDQAQDDKAIASNVEAKLFEDSLLKTRDIRVRTQGGVVTLSGTVNTELENAAAVRIAGTQKGVKRVIDLLAVSSHPSPGPESPPDILGTWWDEVQGGSPAIWTRRGSSNVFDANWENGQVTAVVTVSVQGNQVRAERRSSSDGNDCHYQGVIAPDGVTVSGTFGCQRWVQNSPWRATIRTGPSVKP